MIYTMEAFSVNDSMPPVDPDSRGDDSVNCLLYSVDEEGWIWGYYDFRCKCWDTENGYNRSITHWMLQPPNPNGVINVPSLQS